MVYRSLATLAHRSVHLLQNTCLLCHCHCRDRARSSIFGLCRFCLANLPLITNCCRRCALPLPANAALCGQCLVQPPRFAAAHCATCYEGSMPALVHRLKLRHDNAIIHLLSDLFVQSISRSIPAVDLALIDLALPVPMHIRRNLERGNNHSDLLGRMISQSLGIPFSNRLLQRVRLSPPQQGLSAGLRRNNLANAFVASPAVKGLRIAVIDDVLTTGSTMNEIAMTLAEAGALEVHAWALARTPSHLGS